jgi:uncharacterized protein (TIGR03435 family)
MHYRRLRIAVGCLSLSLLTTATLNGQADQTLTFEVASVKPNTSPNAPQGIRVLPSGQLTATNMPVVVLIRNAWATDAIQIAGQIVGGPAWINTERYDINAKAEGGFTRPDDFQRFQAMLRALLADRFKVRVHTEMRDVPVYALMLANKDGKLGPRLIESHADCYSAASPPPPNAPPDPARMCGIRGGNGDVTYQSVTTQNMARNLANFPVVGRPVIDRTGLTARYDLHLQFVPAFIDSPNRDGSVVANPAAEAGANLFTALVEEAGLKLEAERAMVEFIVIDQVERPTSD